MNEPVFLLFYGYAYYPVGGWHDFKGFYESEQLAYEAYENAQKLKRDDHCGEYDWFHIIDSASLKCVRFGGQTCYASGEPPMER